MLNLLCCAIALLTVSAADGEKYHWPLELERQLTSSFAEYRPGRFHAGIDLRTGGIGQPVYAADDAYVSRVRCSPYGYGKAIYLQLSDGNTMVYAHLDDYYDDLRFFVQSEQHRAQKYTVDLYPAAGRFKVKRGQVIAKSGQTGIGAPHLHYELRNSLGNPINPRQVNTYWPDSVRPEIRKFLVIPNDKTGSVNGDLLPVVQSVTHLGGGKYKTAPVKASGRIGIGLDVRDPGSGGYSLGVHSIRYMADGREIFRMQHDSLSYDNHSDAAVSYHPYMLGKGRFLNLWRWPGNECASYSHTPGTGWYEVPDTASELMVEVTDYWGHTVTLVVPVYPETAPEKVMSGTIFQDVEGTQGKGKISLDVFGNALQITAEFTATEVMVPELIISWAGGNSAPHWQKINSRIFRAQFIPEQSGEYTVKVVHPGIDNYSRSFGAFLRGQGGSYTANGVKVDVPSDAPYGLLLLRIYDSAESRKTSLRMKGKAISFWPANMPIDASITVNFPRPASMTSAGGAHVYRMSGSGWSRESSSVSGKYFRFTTGELGTYAVLVDDKPPVISSVSPADSYQAKSRRPYIKATVADTGSGVSYWNVTCGGQWLLTSYDPEHSLIEWERDLDLPSGNQEVFITVSDAAGNPQTVRRKISVP